MSDRPDSQRLDELHARLRQLILMRETGPKRSAWHAARMRLIWRLHDQLRQAEAQQEPPQSETPPAAD